MKASWLYEPSRAGWLSAENISPDTELSGSACSACHGWAAHTLIAITVSWPTSTSTKMAAYVQSYAICPTFVTASHQKEIVAKSDFQDRWRKKTAVQLRVCSWSVQWVWIPSGSKRDAFRHGKCSRLWLPGTQITPKREGRDRGHVLLIPCQPVQRGVCLLQHHCTQCVGKVVGSQLHFWKVLLCSKKEYLN